MFPTQVARHHQALLQHRQPTFKVEWDVQPASATFECRVQLTLASLEFAITLTYFLNLGSAQLARRL